MSSVVKKWSYILAAALASGAMLVPGMGQAEGCRPEAAYLCVESPTYSPWTESAGVTNWALVWVGGYNPNSTGTYNVSTGADVTLGAISPFQGSLFVGSGGGGTGTVNVANTGKMTLKGMTLGNTATDVGSVVVDNGTITTTDSNSQYYIGNSGKGTLTVKNGGSVFSLSQTYVAYQPNSTGTLNVEGSGSAYTETGLMYVANGAPSTAYLNVTGGGTVSTLGGAMQIGGGGTAEAVVSGVGSTLTAGAWLAVGVMPTGNGSLTISGGGAAGSSDATRGTYLAYNPGAQGTITVSGAGSLTSTNLYVGAGGQANLQVQAGGAVTIDNDTVVGSVASSGWGVVSSGSVAVSGTGASFKTGNLTIGAGGEGTMTVSAGGTIEATGGVFIADRQCGALAASFCGGPGTGQGSGALNIGAAAGSPAAPAGVFTAPTVTFGNGLGVGGTGKIVFNHTDTSGSYVFAPAVTGGNATTSDVEVYSGNTVMTGVSNYYGGTDVYGGILSAGVISAFSPNSDYDVKTGATLDLRGRNQTVKSLDNAGLVKFGGTPPVPGAQLTTGNYS
ncbi:MAG: hypothetical protein LBE75_05550 [Burkholderiales bacterium]|nr:hypothetical protein [Burkholderiales bacterium]